MPSQTVWYLPSWMVKVEAQVLSPFYLSIHTPRFVRNDAPIWQLILRADVDGVREQFKSGEASVYDVNEGGRTVLSYARDAWLHSRCSNPGQVRASYDMFAFLEDAGADPEFSIGQQLPMKLLLAYASLETLIEHPDAVFAHKVKTNTIAVDICQSIFHVDAIDLVEDYLDWWGIESDSDPVAAALLGYSSSTDITNLDMFQSLTPWTALEYAAAFYPKHVESLLQRGEDAKMKAPLATAAHWDNASIIKPLVEAGASVNAYNRQGMTALHYACYRLNIDTLKTLIQCAGEDEIDWEARTRDGRNLNALQVAKASPFHSWHSKSDIQELFDILCAHIPEPYEELHDGDEPVRMPGSFE
ncbi:hypothetical protein BC835DRAFT_1419898 [Cytidiella melzeri]|nr:hypothetical protein BC835DRAFT_1419898 [Cytidiella melzeri]